MENRYYTSMEFLKNIKGIVFLLSIFMTLLQDNYINTCILVRPKHWPTIWFKVKFATIEVVRVQFGIC